MPDRPFTYPDMQKVLENDSLSKDQKIEKLEQMLDNERQMQRAATESNIVVGADQGMRMQHLRRALSSLGEEPSEKEKSAATL